MKTFDDMILRQRRRLSVGVFLATFADALAVFLLVFGTLVLAVKLGRPGWWPHVAWVAVGAVPVAAWAWLRTQRNGFSRTQAVALLDRRLGAGGLLMTLSESYDERWAERLSTTAGDWRRLLPRLRPVRAVRRLWLPALFALIACGIPLREARTENLRPNVVGHEVAESLNETLELLKENEVLEPKDAEQLEEAIAKIAQETKDAPLTHETWEVVDALRDKMRVRTDDALTAASQASDALEGLSTDASPNSESMTSERRQQLENEASESLRKMSKSGNFAKASPKLQAALKQLLKNGKLQLPKDPAEREKLLSDLKQFLKDEKKKLSECRGKCKGGLCEGQCEGECENPAGRDAKSGRPGRGGVTRGRGDAEMTWGDEAELNGTKFKEVVLPPGTPDEPNKEVISHSASAPEVNAAGDAPRSAARAAGLETGRQTWNRTLRPRHRPVVKNFFNSPKS